MINLPDSSLNTSPKVSMPGFMKRTGCFVKVLVLVFAASWATAQVESGASGHILITQPVDEGKLVTLKSNTRPEANAANDRGAVGDQFHIEHMLLHLRRSPASERALQKFIAGLQTPGSPNFHHWITAQEFGDRFGLAKPDLATVTEWLQSHGFKVNVTYPNGLMIDFSGTAGQVREAFRTEIHRLEVDGRTHIANMSDPQIPCALAPAVAGIVSLHDFMPRTMYQMRPAYTFTTNGTFEGVVPADLATIYNLNPLFNSGTSGQGQTIVVIENTDVPNGNSNQDWPTFRSTFGISGYGGNFTQVNPAPSSGGTNCSDPGVNANDIEAILDAEYASAAAPSATIELASCSDSGVTFGGLIALQNLLNQGTPPAIVSISYGECEATNGAAANLAYSSTYAQAVTEGVSVFVASGDEGAAGCDPRSSVALHGIGVNGFASTPYNVAVGGTDFGDTYAGTTSKYWSSTNTATYGSAQSYVPEIPWNDSCASVLIANFDSFSTTYGASGFCNSSTGASFLTTAAGSGGPSGCATGAANTPGVVDGTCAGWAKPAWQAVVGNPADNVRDLPDVSLFAANGVWGHYYIFCDSDTNYGGTPCPPGNPSAWSGAGGTSFAAPIMAGIQALINQKAGSSQGNPNPIYYSLAAAEYGGAGSASCDSTSGNGPASSCIFYDVSQGDMDLACYTGSPNCYQPSPGATYGVLSTSNSSYSPAYGTATGWDFATGLGTLNAANLVNNWPTATTPNFSFSPSPNNLTIAQTSSGASTITITPTNGFTGSVSLWVSGLPNGVTASFDQNPATTTAHLTLTASGIAPIGTVTLTIFGSSGSLSHTATMSLSVIPAFTLSASPNSLSITQGASGGTSTITIAPANGFSGAVNFSATGLPSGVTAGFSPISTTTASTLTLTAAYGATLGTSSVTIVGTYGAVTETATISLTVVASPPPNFSLTASPNSVMITQGGASGSTGITVASLFNFSGNVTLSATGLPNRVTASFSPNPTAVTGTVNGASTLTLTASSTATIGTVTVTITGTSGGLTSSTTVSLNVSAGTSYQPSFQLPATYLVGSGPTAVTVGNFNVNVDGYPDLAVANGGDNTVSVLIGNQDGTFQSAVNSSVGNSPTALAAGNFNGDGYPDLAVANGGDNTISVLIGNGDGTFGTATNSPIPVGKNPTGVAVGDFNNDGNLDLVVANGGDNTLSVLVGNGDGTFKGAVSYPVGSSPTAVAVGDFNGDGKQDVAVANAGSNTVSILLGNGDCTFQASTTFQVGSKPVSLAVGDFNQDVQPDLAVANQGDSDVSILLNNANIQAPAITSGNSATFKVGVPGAFTVTAGGFPVITAAGQLPNGVTFNDNRIGTASIVGIPAAGTGGSYPITLTASPKNGSGSPATQNFTLQVNQAPAITTPNSTTFTAGGQGSFTVTASGYPAPVLTESGVLPSGVMFNAGILSGTPAAGTGGTYSITFTAHNGSGPDATQMFTLTVDQAPAFTSASAVTFVSGTPGAFTVTTLGFPPSTLSVAPQPLPAGVTFTDNGNGTGNLNAAANAATGVFTLTFNALNGVGAPAIQNFNLTIGASQTITFLTSAPPTAAYGSNFTVAATGGGSGNQVVFSSSGVCSNVGGTYTMTSGSGTCSVIANQAGSNGYLPASQVTQTTTATLAVNPITFTINAPSQAAYPTSFTVAATGNSSNPVIYESYGSCRNSGATYSMWEGKGACTVTAFQFNDNNYASGTASETTTAIPASQTITFTINAPASASYGSTFSVAATGGASGIPVVFTSSGACTNNGSTYTMTGASGSCSVIANQAGSQGPYYLYAAAPTVTEMTAATLATQTVTFTTKAPASAAYGSSFNVAANASSGLPITYTSSGACSNSGATYTMTSGTGTCSVTAFQPGNSNYSAANSVTESTTATKLSQSITFTTSAPSSAVYGTSFAVVATASSGLPITYTSSGSCSNVGAVYTMTSGGGSCSVIANQPGNSNYLAARQVTQSTTAQKANASVSISNIPGNAVAGKSFSPTYSTNSNGTASVTSSTSTTCTVSGSTVSFRAAGTCTLVAHTASTSNYNAGTGASQSFTIIAVTVTSISPTSGLRGTNFQVTLNGTNLSGATAVVVSGTGVTVSNISSTATTVTATFTIAANATVSSRTVSVTTPIGNSNTVTFAVTGPTLTSISPPNGTHGTTVPVTLTGTNLSGATAISVSGGGIQVTGLQVTNSTTVTANFVISSGATLSSRSVSVTTPIGTTTGNVTFTVK
jgi:subtilase family serine protease